MAHPEEDAEEAKNGRSEKSFHNRFRKETAMKKRLGGIALVALAGALVFAVGCEKEPTREEIMRKQWGDIMTKSKFEKMKAEAEAKRKAQEEAFSKTIGGAMIKRTLETASGTAKKDKEADDRVRRALDRDFGAPQPASKPTTPAPHSASKEQEGVTNRIDFTDEDFK